jgi:ABC-2 type transport system ATP-binding protein
MSGEVSIRAAGLTRRFDDFVAVDAISFEISAGEIWGFLGPNGSGKSTTIRMLCGVLEPSAGRANVLGYDVARDPEAVKLRIGYVSQGSSLWKDLTVVEHLRFTAGLFGLSGAAQRTRVDEWMERLGLAERRDELAGSLPGGYRKRLAIACALLHTPRVLFLDEPTSGVDPVSRREFWDLIVDIADTGTTVMVTTHYLDEAEHCNQLAFIYGGKIIARGTPDEIKHASAAGVTVEVTSPKNVELLDLLDGESYVASSSLYGSSLHVTLHSEAELGRLRGFLTASGVAAASLDRITPSLEDVFAVLIKAATA